MDFYKGIVMTKTSTLTNIIFTVLISVFISVFISTISATAATTDITPQDFFIDVEVNDFLVRLPIKSAGIQLETQDFSNYSVTDWFATDASWFMVFEGHDINFTIFPIKAVGDSGVNFEIQTSVDGDVQHIKQFFSDEFNSPIDTSQLLVEPNHIVSGLFGPTNTLNKEVYNGSGIVIHAVNMGFDGLRPMTFHTPEPSTITVYH